MTNAVKKLREDLGMADGQLLTTDSGMVADILAVNDEVVTLGILSGGVIEVPLWKVGKKK